jgi:tetratricopeptide (TPR) repeat protein
MFTYSAVRWAVRCSVPSTPWCFFRRASCCFVLSVCLFCLSCRNGNEKLVDPAYADSLIRHYTLPATILANEQEIQFWKNRIDPKNPGMVNESRYAASLAARFHQLGDIADIRKADSILRRIDTLFNHKEAGPNLSLVGYSILQHRFAEADSFLVKAKAIGLKRYEWLTALFDVSFETGRYDNALIALGQLKADADYGYYFRRSKMDHLNGSLDSSIAAMLKAADLAGNSLYLKQVALSNAADLYIHAGRLKEARDLYMRCIRMNSADFHSITGLGWIALVHDKNDTLAQNLFQLVHSKNKLPDPLFKLAQIADAEGNELVQTGYAGGFSEAATAAVYGNMYNKYLIELFTGILKEPDLAVTVAKRELDNRATPQTYAWYAWALATSGKKDDAYKVFQEHVSGKPLEGLELYWMGKLMQQLNKGYNASEFFKAAYKNKYDLSPGMVRDLEKMDH